MSASQKTTHRVAVVGTGNFATNLVALLSSHGIEPVFFVDEYRQGTFLDRPVLAAADLARFQGPKPEKWVVAISDPGHRQAAVDRLIGFSVPSSHLLPLNDDPALQILRLLFEEYGPEAMDRFCEPGLVSVADLEEYFLGSAKEQTLARLSEKKQTIALGYFGRGGGFRRHISSLVPLLADRFNVLTMSDELMGAAEEADHHLYLSAESACQLDGLDLVLSAHVFPCAAPSVPRVSFSHVIYDFNLTSEYHAARIGLSDTHYLFASSRPSFDAYVDLVKRFDLKNRICVVPGGYLQLDRNLAAMKDSAVEATAILYAPTLSLADYPHHELVTSLQQGPAILTSLLAAFPDRQIIYRPHPSDLRLHELDRNDARSENFGRLLELCRQESRCTLDDNATSYLDSYRQAALMVSDSSSTAFTFAFATGRPVVFFSPHEKQMVATLGDQLQFVGDRQQVGLVVETLKDLVPGVERLLQKEVRGEAEGRSLENLRNRMIFNLGSSAEYFVDNIDYMLDGTRHPDWLYLNW